MGKAVCQTAMCTCDMGSTPASLVVTSNQIYSIANLKIATIMDHAPVANLATFGMCRIPANPAVAAATTAALGVLTPAPCIPATAAPWTPGSVVQSINGLKVLTDDSKLLCSYGGTISITQPSNVIESTQ